MHFRAICRFENIIAFRFENTFQRVACYQLVFNDKNVRGLHVCYLNCQLNRNRKYKSP
ncbi:Uncharacterised protein [Shigella sonnei]|nr:Uncharacterised protein [Shigella sonnei]CSG33272.1 Uncharacterised protein [Shigella sonnei]CSG35047.1 Uncharacterised protein [Shigella sonnei]CST39275.1 Uncharacterised protein [Shigella sonnei]